VKFQASRNGGFLIGAKLKKEPENMNVGASALSSQIAFQQAQTIGANGRMTSPDDKGGRSAYQPLPDQDVVS
jgi:hypothetical protein